MTRLLLVSTLCVLALVLGGGLGPAEASHNDWFVAGNFAVGGLNFALGYQQPAYRYGYGYPVPHPVYYYRVERPLTYPGVRCTTACYIRDHSYYHHPSCPLVGHHFRSYDYRPRWGYGGYGGYDHRSYAPRPHDYWNDYRYRYHDDDDYRHRGRGRGHDKHHRHDRYCDHDD